MVAVLAISDSSRASLLAVLDRLGTNMLTVSPGQSFMGDDTALPDEALGMIRRIRPVQAASAATTLADIGPPDRPDQQERDGRPVRAGRGPLAPRDAGRHGPDGPLPGRGPGAVPGRRAGLGGRGTARHRGPRRTRAGLDRRPLVHGRRHPGLAAARPGAGPGGAHRPRRRGDLARGGHRAVDRLHPREPGQGRRGAGGPGGHRQPREPRGRQRPASVGRDRGAGRGGDHVHHAVPGPGGRGARRWRPSASPT